MGNRSDEIHGSKAHWLTIIKLLKTGKELEQFLFPCQQEMQELAADDLKAVCYALLCPRFQPQGEAFIGKKLRPHFDDQEFSHARELARTGQYSNLLTMLESHAPGMLTHYDRQFAEQLLPKTPSAKIVLTHEDVRAELERALRPRGPGMTDGRSHF